LCKKIAKSFVKLSRFAGVSEREPAGEIPSAAQELLVQVFETAFRRANTPHLRVGGESPQKKPQQRNRSSECFFRNPISRRIPPTQMQRAP
jgi:hypothetical protein